MLNNPWILGGNSLAQGQISNPLGNASIDGIGGSGHMVVQTQSLSISSSDGSVIHQTNTYESWVTVSGPQSVGLDMVPGVVGQNMFGALDMNGAAALSSRGPETYVAVPMTSEGLTSTPALAVGIHSPFVTHNQMEPIVALPAQMTVSEPSMVTAVQNPSETYIAFPVPMTSDPLVAVPTVQNIYSPLVSANAAEAQVPLIHTSSQSQANINPSWYLVVQDMPEPMHQVNCTADTPLLSRTCLSEDRLHLCVRCDSAFEKLSCLEWHLRDCRGILNDHHGISFSHSANGTARKLQTIQCALCRRLFTVLEEIRIPFTCIDCGQRSTPFSVSVQSSRQLRSCCECNEQFEFESEFDDHVCAHKSSVTICELPDNYVEENGNEDSHVSVMIEPPEENEDSDSCESGSSDEDCEDEETCSFEICSECGRNFESVEDLNTHLKSHDSIQSHGCSKCGIICVGKYNLGKHIASHLRREKAKEVLADSCFENKEENTKDRLVIRPFGCTECGMRFADSNELKEHCVTHLRAKPFSCTQCGEKFENTGSLEKHWEAHNCVM